MTFITNGQCPHCKTIFDAKEAKLAFPGNVKGKSISLVFALCPKCYYAFMEGDIKKQTETITISYTNFMGNPHRDWTVTTSLALNAHSEYFFNAWWYGIDVPEVLFDAFNEGLVDEIACFPPIWRHWDD